MTTPSPRHLIDSSILIPYIRGNQAFVTRLDALANKYVSPTIVGELAYGALRSTHPQGGMTRVTTILAPFPVLSIDQAVGYSYAAVKNFLVTRNQLIPDSDMWIATVAIVNGVTLIARDAHFGRLVAYGLRFQAW
jgi:tRNA(fMet)-specific endonuclease VapC